MTPTAITWLGHATVLIEIDGTRLLTDPVLGNRIGPLLRTAAKPPIEASQALDGVLISHIHADHADVSSLRRVARSLPVLAPVGAGSWLAGKGLGDVRELPAGSQERIGAIRVTATPARHEGRRAPFGPQAEAIGFVAAGSRSVYFAGDTDLFDAMTTLAGAVDVALLPVWGWGPTLGPGHLDPARAAEAAALIQPAVAVPIHWGTLALPWVAVRQSRDRAAPAREFRRLCLRAAPAVDVRVLEPGQRLALP